MIGIKPETIRFTVDLDPELHRELKLLALEEGCSATEVIRYALRQVLAQRKEVQS